MWFRSLSFFRLSADFVIDESKLAQQLVKFPFTRCSGLDWFTEGWVPPAGHLDSPVYTHRDRSIVSLRREDKVLPGSVIKDALEEKVTGIEEAELRKVGRKEKLALKEQITDDLLPRAFTKSKRTTAYVDRENGWLVVDTSTASAAEALVSKLREALPPFPAALPRTKISPHSAMTDWLASGEVAGGFELDSECWLADSSENGASVRFARMDLTADEVKQHIATGKQVVSIGLIWRERIRFILTEHLQLKRLQFLDVLQEEASQSGDDLAALFEGTFLLMSEELGDLLNELVELLGGLDDEQKTTPVADQQVNHPQVEEVPWA